MQITADLHGGEGKSADCGPHNAIERLHVRCVREGESAELLAVHLSGACIHDIRTKGRNNFIECGSSFHVSGMPKLVAVDHGHLEAVSKVVDDGGGCFLGRVAWLGTPSLPGGDPADAPLRKRDRLRK